MTANVSCGPACDGCEHVLASVRIMVRGKHGSEAWVPLVSVRRFTGREPGDVIRHVRNLLSEGRLVEKPLPAPRSLSGEVPDASASVILHHATTEAWARKVTVPECAGPFMVRRGNS